MMQMEEFMGCAPLQLTEQTLFPGKVSDEEKSLQNAFASFTEAAASLEISYRQLHVEVNRLRQELERTNQDLQQTQAVLRRKQALAEIAAMLAHEIRNPLGSMELLTALLEESATDPQGREWMDQLRAGVRMLSATVNNVLQFYSPSQQELLPVNLEEVLASAARFLRPLAQQSSVRVEVRNGLHDAVIAADRHCLQQVLLNLALNAFRAMSKGGILKMHGYVSPKNFAVVEIADDGCGIPALDLPFIFQPNFTSRKGSPGIGLTVCKEIVERHRGTIAVSSTVGNGTIFTLRFPIMEAAA